MAQPTQRCSWRISSIFLFLSFYSASAILQILIICGSATQQSLAWTQRSPFFATSRMMEASLAFLQSPPHILPMPTFLPALQCPHTPPQTTSHPFTLPPASHPSAKSVLLQLPSAKLPLPFLDPSTFCLPQFTAFIMQCSPRPSTHFLCYCYCRTPRQVTVCTAGSSSSAES